MQRTTIIIHVIKINHHISFNLCMFTNTNLYLLNLLRSIIQFYERNVLTLDQVSEEIFIYFKLPVQNDWQNPSYVTCPSMVHYFLYRGHPLFKFNYIWHLFPEIVLLQWPIDHSTNDKYINFTDNKWLARWLPTLECRQQQNAVLHQLSFKWHDRTAWCLFFFSL